MDELTKKVFERLQYTSGSDASVKENYAKAIVELVSAETGKDVIDKLGHEKMGMEMYIKNDCEYSRGAVGGLGLAIEIVKQVCGVK